MKAKLRFRRRPDDRRERLLAAADRRPGSQRLLAHLVIDSGVTLDDALGLRGADIQAEGSTATIVVRDQRGAERAVVLQGKLAELAQELAPPEATSPLLRTRQGTPLAPEAARGLMLSLARRAKVPLEEMPGMQIRRIARSDPGAPVTAPVDDDATAQRATDEQATEPAAHDDDATRQRATDEQATEPAAHDDDATRQRATDEQATEPAAHDDDATRQRATDEQATEPAAHDDDATRQRATDEQATEPAAHDDDATRQRATDEQATEPAAHDDDATRQRATDEQATEPAAHEPAATDAGAQRHAGQPPTSKQPASGQPADAPPTGERAPLQRPARR